MKITREEILRLADSIKISLTDVEIIEISKSIEIVSIGIDSLLKYEVQEEPKIIQSTQENQFNDKFEEEIDSQIMMNSLNNYDGTYIKTGKVIEND